MSTVASGRRRRRPLAEAIVLLGIVGVIVLIGVRVCSYQKMSTGRPNFGQPNIESQKQVIPARPHNVTVMLTDPDSIRQRVAYTWSTDENGFRGESVPQQKPEGGFRVAVVGECVAFGQGVNDDESWPALLEELLAERLGGRHVDVVNASSPDPPTAVVQRADRVVPAFDPDVLMLAAGAELIFDGGEPYVHGRDPVNSYRRFRPKYEGEVRGVLETCRKHGVEPVLVTPTFNTFTNPGATAWVQWTADIGRRESVPVLHTTDLLRAHEERDGLLLEREATRQRLIAVDAGTPSVLLEVDYTGDQYVAPEVYAWLDDHPGVSLSMTYDENHPRPEGHRVIAAAAMALIEEQGWLDPGNP